MRLPDDQGTTRPAGARGNGRDEGREADSAGLGPRVTAVFTAAEQAADHILQMAREEVADMRRRAESEVEAFRREQRHQAAEEARLLVAEAREEADSIRREAKAAAEAIEEAARTKERWVNEGIRLMMERAEWGRRGLEEVLARLEPFAIRPPHEWSDVPREPLASLAESPDETPPPDADGPAEEPAAAETPAIRDDVEVPGEAAEPAVASPDEHAEEPLARNDVEADPTAEADDWRPWRAPHDG